MASLGLIWKLIEGVFGIWEAINIFTELTKDRSAYRDMSSSAKAQINGLEREINSKIAHLNHHLSQLERIPPDQVNIYIKTNRVNSIRLEIADSMKKIAEIIEKQIPYLKENSYHSVTDARERANKIRNEATKIRNSPIQKIPYLRSINHNQETETSSVSQIEATLYKEAERNIPATVSAPFDRTTLIATQILMHGAEPELVGKILMNHDSYFQELVDHKPAEAVDILSTAYQLSQEQQSYSASSQQLELS
jgi:vacuolar-type H+-ATPase subunit H